MSWVGHAAVVQILLDNDAEANAQGGYYGHALQAASIEGRTPIVKMLLDMGVDVNAQGGQFGSALHATSEQGDAYSSGYRSRRQCARRTLQHRTTGSIMRRRYSNCKYSDGQRCRHKYARGILWHCTSAGISRT